MELPDHLLQLLEDGVVARREAHQRLVEDGRPIEVIEAVARVLLDEAASEDKSISTAAFKALAKEAHPDAGGSDEQMKELNAVIEEFRAKQAVEG